MRLPERAPRRKVLWFPVIVICGRHATSRVVTFGIVALGIFVCDIGVWRVACIRGRSTRRRPRCCIRGLVSVLSGGFPLRCLLALSLDKSVHLVGERTPGRLNAFCEERYGCIYKKRRLMFEVKAIEVIANTAVGIITRVI